MGGDSPPQVLFEAVQLAAEQLGPSYSLLVIATKSVVDQLALSHRCTPSEKSRAPIEFHIVADTITMGDEPLGAVRRKKGSSIVVGIRLLKKKLIQAFVSIGNTGALVASATLSLPMLPGIKRPALLTVLPTASKFVAVLDVGGNVSCKALHLVQFAHLGAAYYQAIYGIRKPVVSLLNIGIESKKGTKEVCQAYGILKTESQDPSCPMQFLGNIEARQVFQGVVDVLVTDGFTGNVLLKTTEGVAEFIFGFLNQTLEAQHITSLKNSLDDLQKHFSYDEYPGAFVCGVDGIVVKCHGYSSVKALLNGIKGAVDLVEKQVIERIKAQSCKN
jgi:glycerol-3-phosphate acyltransferase PlsX